MSENKSDPELGIRVHQYLTSIGLETPGVKVTGTSHLATHRSSQVENLTKFFGQALREIGSDLTDDSLIDTPRRIAKMWINEIFSGLYPENFPKITVVENKMKYDEMVLEKNITVMSTCEHHHAQIAGFAHVAYIPKDKVAGLSKLNRVVRYFSQRPQIQERLTEQIYHALSYVLETPDVAVFVDADHFCVKSRGVADTNSRTSTSKLGGVFKSNPLARSEFLSLISK